MTNFTVTLVVADTQQVDVTAPDADHAVQQVVHDNDKLLLDVYDVQELGDEEQPQR